MPYKIKFRESARLEFDQCCATYPGINKILNDQLTTLATEPEEGKLEASLSWEDILDQAEGLEKLISEMKGDFSSFSHFWKRFKKINFWDKLRACSIIVKKRKPPWELRCSQLLFTYLGNISCEVFITYELDHVSKILVVTLFAGLPGQ